jgi:hypothetical protein
LLKFDGYWREDAACEISLLEKKALSIVNLAQEGIEWLFKAYLFSTILGEKV